MRKYLFTLLLMLSAGLTAQAQSTLVATLINTAGSVESTYYGAGALQEAYNKALRGYTIVLSPGQFNSNFSISKLITIRGAGMCEVPDKSITPTVLNGSPVLSFGSTYNYTSDSYRLKIEGVCLRDPISFANNCCMKDVQFIKCRLGDIIYSSLNSPWENVSFVDCYILGHVNIPGGNSSVSFYNCAVQLISSKNSSSTVLMENCVAKLNGQGTTGIGIVQGLLRNCFLLNESAYSYFPPATTVCQNCYSTILGFFNKQTNESNVVLATDLGDIFANFDDTAWNEEHDFFKLTSWAATNCLGSDGKQMGIYGGFAPFSPLTSAPQITKFEAPETTSDGTLRVSIKVEMPQ